MPRYIDADKILSHLNDEIEGCGDCDVYSQPVVYGTRLGLEYSKSLVETAETVDAQEVRHGRWHTIRETTDSKTTECTACMKSFFFMRKGQLNIDLMSYCPHCGAKMDGKEAEAKIKGGAE